MAESMSTFNPRFAVRWRDLDQLGHVNSVVFLTYLEEGRTTWLGGLLGPQFETNQYVIARVELDYLAEIPSGTEFVETQHEIAAVGRSSVTLDESLSIVGGGVAARGRVVLVMWEPDHHRSRQLSSHELAALNQQLMR
ncbi:MAG: acyl-CoA thioesterase [Acidimicrobiales bacterium]